MRRAGELLHEFDARGDHRRNGLEGISSRTDAATAAGMADKQRVKAMRVAAVPEAVFEKQVESNDPPTVKSLAAQGTKPRPKPLVSIFGMKTSFRHRVRAPPLS
jgi:hypothetical protein